MTTPRPPVGGAQRYDEAPPVITGGASQCAFARLSLHLLSYHSPGVRVNPLLDFYALPC